MKYYQINKGQKSRGKKLVKMANDGKKNKSKSFYVIIHNKLK